ncbi:MAG: PQQ-dependent sugar dehydrogenase [Myxococcota bacterium]
MNTRASLLLHTTGLAAGLMMAGCPGDDSSASGSASAGSSGSTTQGSADTTNGPGSTPADTTMSPSTDTETVDSTGTDDSTGTTSGILPCPYEEVDGMPALALELVGEGFDRPVLAIGHPTEPDRLFVVEQGGNIRILEPGQTMAPAESFLFVDVASANNSSIGSESGLLGFAFHPNFPDDPRVYVNYNPPAPGFEPLHTIVSEFTVDANDPNAVDPASERIILDLEQPAGNHNGGMIQFDSAGYLLIGMGDGGGGGDTFNTGRNQEVMMAKMLRIGVEPDGEMDDPVSCVGCDQYGPFDYTIPDDNPFVDDPAFAPEIYAWGLRNPWRFAIDPETDLIYAGDVGQNEFEEITLINSGADLGWSDMEGFSCFEGAACDEAAGPNEINAQGMTMPLLEYSHDVGIRCSVTGGAVYHSCEVPAWDGIYFYGDYCTGELFGLVWDGASVTDLGVLLDQNELPLGNGWNAYGDVFITTVDAILGGPISDGLVYRLAPAR